MSATCQKKFLNAIIKVGISNLNYEKLFPAFILKNLILKLKILDQFHRNNKKRCQNVLQSKKKFVKTAWFLLFYFFKKIFVPEIFSVQLGSNDHI